MDDRGPDWTWTCDQCGQERHRLNHQFTGQESETICYLCHFERNRSELIEAPNDQLGLPELAAKITLLARDMAETGESNE